MVIMKLAKYYELSCPSYWVAFIGSS